MKNIIYTAIVAASFGLAGAAFAQTSNSMSSGTSGMGATTGTMQNGTATGVTGSTQQQSNANGSPTTNGVSSNAKTELTAPTQSDKKSD